MASKRSWPRATWDYPLPHDFIFGFGLGMESATRASTIVPYLMQDNAIIDYETIKVNPENDDFAVVAKPNVAAGSFVPRVMTTWQAFCFQSEVELLKFKYLPINISMLNRLDAFDKKTGNDIETILELTHETTDEQCYPLWNTTKVFEGHGVNDLPAEVPGLTANQQPEGVAFDMELYFDALHYYTNKEMLRSVTGRMMNFNLGAFSDPIPMRDKVKSFFSNAQKPVTKSANPYTFCGGLFHLPQVGTNEQYELAAGVTDIEHLTIVGRCRFNEFNPDFNRSRA